MNVWYMYRSTCGAEGLDSDLTVTKTWKPSPPKNDWGIFSLFLSFSLFWLSFGFLGISGNKVLAIASVFYSIYLELTALLDIYPNIRLVSSI
jgi:hypothetical protein